MSSVAVVLVSDLLAMQGEMELLAFLVMAIFPFVMFGRQELVQNGAHTMQLIKAAMDKLDENKQTEFIDEDGTDQKLDHFDIAFRHVDFGYENR